MAMADRLVGRAAGLKIDPKSTGLNPAWRSASALAVRAELWEEGLSVDGIEKFIGRVKNSIKAMEALAPGSGSYFNEVRSCGFDLKGGVHVGHKASLFEKTPKQTFFGSHYEWLKKIKDRYDPVGMFLVAEGVGSDELNESLNCRR